VGKGGAVAGGGGGEGVCKGRWRKGGWLENRQMGGLECAPRKVTWARGPGGEMKGKGRYSVGRFRLWSGAFG